jgi:hypothetical protein
MGAAKPAVDPSLASAPKTLLSMASVGRPLVSVEEPAAACSPEMTTIGIMGFGLNTFQDAVEDAIADLWPDAVELYELHKMVTEKLGEDRVNKGQDGTHAKTVRGVLAQQQFADAVSVILEDIMRDYGRPDSRFIPICCRTSFHRTDVCGRLLENILNSMLDGLSRRMFNACFFPVCNCTGWKDAQTQVKRCMRWTREPWELMATPTAAYGAVECSSSPQANKHFKLLWSRYPWGNLPMSVAAFGGNSEAADTAGAYVEETFTSDEDEPPLEPAPRKKLKPSPKAELSKIRRVLRTAEVLNLKSLHQRFKLWSACDFRTSSLAIYGCQWPGFPKAESYNICRMVVLPFSKNDVQNNSNPIFQSMSDIEL